MHVPWRGCRVYWREGQHVSTRIRPAATGNAHNRLQVAYVSRTEYPQWANSCLKVGNVLVSEVVGWPRSGITGGGVHKSAQLRACFAAHATMWLGLI